MKNYLFPILIGLVVGVIDILPMLKQKLDKFSITSAFLFHLIMPLIVFNIDLGLVWWLKGGIVYLFLCLPTVVLIARDDKKSVPVVAVSSLVLGTAVGVLSHFIL
jgi:hypothetical protein